MRASKKQNRKQSKQKKDKPPEGREEQELLVFLWLMSHRHEEADSRIFNEWSYNM